MSRKFANCFTSKLELFRQELFALQKEHADDFVSARLRRSAGTATKHLMLVIYRDKVVAQGRRGIPPLREFVASHPAANYANVSPQIEAFAVIHRMAAV